MSWMAIQTNGRVVYSVKKKSVVPQARAQEIGEYIEDLEETMNITPHNLLDDAQRRDSKLHEFFEWDDDRAAGEYRLHQARQIVNHFEIAIVDLQTEEESTTRAWHSTFIAQTDDGDNGDGMIRAYVNTLRVFDEPDYKAQAVENALCEINGWRRRFSIYSELEPIFIGIDEVENSRD